MPNITLLNNITAATNILQTVSLIIYIITIVALWNIFKKMDEPGWKAIIPVYNTYVLFKRTWKTGPFWAILILAIVAAPLSIIAIVAAFIMNQAGPEIATIAILLIFLALIMVISIAILVLEIIQNVKMAKIFGHGGGFAVGLIFLGWIFLLVLAFDNSEYLPLKAATEAAAETNAEKTDEDA